LLFQFNIKHLSNNKGIVLVYKSHSIINSDNRKMEIEGILIVYSQPGDVKGFLLGEATPEEYEKALYCEGRICTKQN
jgi:hypothetical protein